MFKLPVCPHCGTIYRYKDTKTAIRQKQNECYHCHRSFRVKLFPFVLVEAVILISVCIAINLLILSRMTTFDLLPLFLITIGFLMIIILLIPFFTHFVKTDEMKTNYVKKRQEHQKRKK